MPASPLHTLVLQWYARHARDLPWRRPGTSPWGVLVSEVMLAQTPVTRVTPVYEQWLARWPTPAALAAEPGGEALRAWGRLGYPRRALRLHEAATVVVGQHRGELPTTYDGLRALPGVGEYTAAAVLAFAYGGRAAVLDTNVRRVLARVVGGVELPPASLTVAERRTAETLLPDEPSLAARWSVAVMELGALVCSARAPRCGECPVRASCAWRAAGSPAYDGPPRRRQAFAGTDRQVRGLIMAALRSAPGPVSRADLDAVWPDPAQRERALSGLLHDGLADEVGEFVRLPR